MGSGYTSNCGWYITVFHDAEMGNVIDGPVTYLSGVDQCTITASGGPVSIVKISCRKKYPFGVGGQFKSIYKLSRPIYVGETGISLTPAEDMFHDGTTFNSTAPVAIENRSFYHASIAQLLQNTNPNAPIYFLDFTNGDDALALADNGGLGYRQLVDYPDPESESNGPQAYRTYEAAFEHARGTTNEFTPLGISAVFLLRGGTTLDGETETSAAAGLFAATGGAALDQPFVIGSYDHASGQAVVKPRSTTGGKWTRTLNIAGSSSYCVLSRNIRIEGTALHRDGTRFSSSSGSPTRQDYLICGVEFFETSFLLTSVHSDFVQERMSFVECVFDGNNFVTDTNANGGAIQGVEAWNAFPWDGLVVKDCVFRRHGNGNKWHPIYLKTNVDARIEDNWFDDCSGTVAKMDSDHGYEVSGNCITRCNSIGNSESNGHSDAGYPTTRTKIAQTDERPATGYAGGPGIGAYGNWGCFYDNTMTDPLAFGVRGSDSNGMFYSVGCVQDVDLQNNLCVFSADNLVSAFRFVSQGGAGDGFVAHTHDTWGRANTIIYTAGGTRQVRLFTRVAATTDVSDATVTEKVGVFESGFENNIVAILNPSSGGESLFRHGGGAGDPDYPSNFVAGRCQYKVRYNNVYHPVGYTALFTNGDTADTQDSIEAWEADMNAGADTPCVGNRAENPGFVNGGYQLSDYLLGLGHASLDDAMDAICAATLAGTMQSGVYATQVAADAVRAAHVNTLDQANYNNAQTGAAMLVQSVSPANILIDEAPDDGTINLGNIAVGANAAVSLNIRNNAPQPGEQLTLGTLSVSAGGTLSVDPSDAVINAGSSVTAEITIDTVLPGARAITVQVPSDDQDNAVYTITINATVISVQNILIDQAPDDGTINLGNIAQGSASSVNLTIRNNAPLPASDLTLGVLSVSAGGALTANPSGSVIAQGSSVAATIAIDTVTEGARAVLVQVPSDDPDNPSYDITINATVVGAELQVTLDDAPLGNGAAIEFTGLVESTHATITLDLTNAGMADLTLGTILTGGRLTTTVNGDPSGEVLGPLDTVSLELVIDTSVVGAVAGSLSIPSNDADSPWVATASGVVAASNAPSDDYTGPSTRQEYLNVAEVGAILAEIIVVSGMLRQAWTSLSTEDQIACIANASIDFDSVRWKGHKLDADQPTAWPRKDRYGNLILPQGEVQYPASLGDGAWSFASLPREIRIGIAVQAAARAADQLNLDQSLQVVGMAAQGITGIGGAGTAWSTEGHIARQPSAQLHRVVRQLVSRYLATGAEFV
jgi:hypothetical protein